MMSTQQKQQNAPAAPNGQASKQSNTGTITKILENFGFIDDTIFFPLSAVKGPNVKVNDKVYYECTYSQNLPFKWNATVVQLVSPTGSNVSGPASSGGGPTYDPRQAGGGYAAGHPPPPMPAHPYQQQQPSGYYQQQQQPPQQQPPPGGPGFYPPQQAPPNSSVKLAPAFAGPQGVYGTQQQQQSTQQQPPFQPQMGKPSIQPGFASQVQQAVAAAAQLQQYYPTQGSDAAGGPGGGGGGNGGANANVAQVANKPGGPPGAPPGAPYGASGPLQYTSQPGAPFQQQYPKGPGGPPPRGGPPPHQGMGPGPRWNDGPPGGDIRGRGPGGPMGGPPRDDRGRFGGPGPHGPPPMNPNGRKEPSRFDNERFNDYGPPPDRFAGPGGDFGRFGGPPGGGGGGGRDEFGRDIRGGVPPPQGGRDRERDFSKNSRERDRSSGKNDRDKERGDRRERDRVAARREDSSTRSSKRSISPVNSVSSGTTRTVPSSSQRTSAGRRFEATNLPKHSISKNRYTSSDLKARLSSSMHIPSDLKEVVFSTDAELDLQAIPKPLIFKIENISEPKEKKSSKSPKKEDKKKETSVVKLTEAKPEDKQDQGKKKDDEMEVEPTKLESAKEENKESEDKSSTVADETKEEDKKEGGKLEESMETVHEAVDGKQEQQSESDVKDNTDKVETPGKVASKEKSKTEQDESIPIYAGKNHKFNVKVLLLQLPTIVEIYDKVFGADFDAVNNSSVKSKLVNFNKIISMLVTKNSNDGYSMIGGKFVRHLDGLLANGEPNLIATAIRAVKAQTGLNLSACNQWRSLVSFVYNRDNEVDHEKASYEVTKIYFPDIWSVFDSIHNPLANEKLEKVDQEDITQPDEQSSSKTDTEAQVSVIKDEAKSEPVDRARLETILNALNDMKVVDLRNELKTFGVKHDSKERKDSLVAKLKAHVQELMKESQSNVVESPAETVETVKVEEEAQSDSDNKRKAADDDDDDDDKDEASKAKKQKTEEETEKVKEKLVASDGSGIIVRGHHLSVISLNSALSPHRFDQFELAVLAELLHDLLIVHFGRYIFSALVYNHNVMKSEALVSPSPSDPKAKTPLAVNYLHLAFAYFDRNHSGYMPIDELTNLMNFIGLPLSKKVVCALATSTHGGGGGGGSELKVFYRDFVLPPNDSFALETSSTTTPPKYPLVAFGSAGGAGQHASIAEQQDGGDQSVLIVERYSIQYNIDELIRQSQRDQKIKVTLNESLVSLTTKNTQLDSTIQELEAKRKKMSAATARQNDEMCALKREKDQLKSKLEQYRRAMEKTVTTFNDLLKQPGKNASQTCGNVSEQEASTPATTITVSSGSNVAFNPETTAPSIVNSVPSSK